MTVRRADDTAYTLLSNGSATGAAISIRGGEYQFLAEGTASGGTISLQAQSPNGTWSNVAVFSGSLVSTTTLPYSQAGIQLPACNVRMATTGGTPSALYASLVGVG